MALEFVDLVADGGDIGFRKCFEVNLDVSEITYDKLPKIMRNFVILEESTPQIVFIVSRQISFSCKEAKIKVEVANIDIRAISGKGEREGPSRACSQTKSRIGHCDGVFVGGSSSPIDIGSAAAHSHFSSSVSCCSDVVVKIQMNFAGIGGGRSRGGIFVVESEQ